MNLEPNLKFGSSYLQCQTGGGSNLIHNQAHPYLVEMV
jgi:hypothetical protein